MSKGQEMRMIWAKKDESCCLPLSSSIRPKPLVKMRSCMSNSPNQIWLQDTYSCVPKETLVSTDAEIG